MARICVIDDKEMMRESVAATLIREDHVVDTYKDPVEGLARIKKERFDLVVTDLKMPRMDGLALIQQIRASGEDIPIIIMTAYAS
ncbi:MAG: response regulator, partial [Gammaproteobacteria bacterium]|nr:response regulator [Gammaproteobacteria bacterium]